MKYGRAVDCGDGPGVKRLTDVVEIPATLPSWANGADGFLSVLYINQKAAWVAADEWFIPVPDGATSGRLVHDGVVDPDPEPPAPEEPASEPDIEMLPSVEN